MTEPAATPEPWERQASETEEAWLAFRSYRDSPPDQRSITRAASVRLSTLSKWYREHSWEDRCRAYDAMFDKVRVEEREAIYRRKARENAIDHMLILADMKDLVGREFAKLREASRDSDMHGLVKAADLIKLAETMIKLERLVAGQTTENVGTTDLDLAKLSLDEIRTMNELMTKAGMKVDE